MGEPDVPEHERAERRNQPNARAHVNTDTDTHTHRAYMHML